MACHKYLTLVSLLIVGIFSFPSPAEACSCMSGTPLCETFWRTSVVFSGEVTAITNANPADPTRPSELFARRRVHFRIDRTYRGDVGSEVDVDTGMGGGDCGFNFVRGQKYLVFANAYEGRLTTSICNLTRRLSEAATELAYLNNPSTAPERGRLFGEARFWDRDGGAPAANQKIALRGDAREWTATTDALGKFEISNVPAGKYQIQMFAPEGWSGQGPLPIEMPDPNACARVDFNLRSRQQRIDVRGSVVLPTARNVAGANMALLSDAPHSRGRVESTAKTDNDGRFVLNGIAGWRYRVRAFVNGRVISSEPFELTPATAPLLIVVR